jgi:2-phosphosulfolactate phosphatase
LSGSQTEYELRCEWGWHGVTQLAPASDVVIVVDVLSFSTSVDVAVSNGATVFPYGIPDDSLEEYARLRAAQVAQRIRTRDAGYSLSPASLTGIEAGCRLVLPSPNGGALSRGTGLLACQGSSQRTNTILTASLRNATAVAHVASNCGATIAVIPAGERWPDGSLRPSLEDWLGAGAVLAALPGRPSAEAQAAVAAFRELQNDLARALRDCYSGQELIERGFTSDVELAAQLDVSHSVPLLRDGAFAGAAA